MREIIKSLNWRQITIYLTATLLLVIGLRRFVFLTDIELTESLANINLTESSTDIVDAFNLENGAKRLTQLTMWLAVCDLLGLLISGFIIYQLTRKTYRYWTNLLIILILGFLIVRFKVLDSGIVKQIVLFIGGQFLRFGLGYALLINGVLLTGLGLFLFYSKRTKELILRAD